MCRRFGAEITIETKTFFGAQKFLCCLFHLENDYKYKAMMLALFFSFRGEGGADIYLSFLLNQVILPLHRLSYRFALPCSKATCGPKYRI